MELVMWTVTKDPRDYPGKLVARKWTVSRDGPRVWPEVLVHDDLDDLRRAVQERGAAVRIGRSSLDDEVILETWL
jgi:hypothetical protein